MIDPKFVINAVQMNAETLRTNYKMIEILEGNLEPYVVNNLKMMLSERVLPYALNRMVPINIVPRYVDKLTNIYQTGVSREVINGDQSDTDLLSWYQEKLEINNVMHQSNRLYNACRATLVHPYITGYGPALRVIPNDRFIVVSTDPVNPTRPTMVILLAGTDAEKREIYWVYTAAEFSIVKSDGSVDYLEMARMGSDGLNPYGVLPFVYINQSTLKLVPAADSDTIKMAEFVPASLTDLNLAACFSCFSMTYVKDGRIENPTYAPNALWFLKSDDPEKPVEIGTIKPEADYNEVLNLIQAEMTMWLGSKGIKAGAIGQLSAESAASGIAKMIDEADTFDVRQAQTLAYGKAERELWSLIFNHMHPIWVSQGLVENNSIFSSTASVISRFSVIPVGTQRQQLISEQRDEYAAGFTTRTRAISALNPQLSAQQIDDLIAEIDENLSIQGVEQDGQPQTDSGTNGQGVDGQQNIQDAVLNGAQVQSAVDIMTAAAIGQIPRESAKALFEMAFQLSPETANRLLSNIGQGFVPAAVQGNVTAKPEVVDDSAKVQG